MNQTVDGDISTCVSVAKIERRGRWSPAPTTTVLAATARCIKIRFVVKARKKAMDADVVVK
ncbi:hypothetical protein ACVXG9_08620 [Escherichia coli]